MSATATAFTRADQAAAWLHAHLADDAQISADSRQVEPGDGFIAMPGFRSDGRQFIDQACARGAAAVLFDNNRFDRPACNVPAHGFADLRHHAGEVGDAFYRHPSRAMTVFAVTGTNGKTTCAHWLAAGAADAGQAGAAIGTMGVTRFGPDLNANRQPGLSTGGLTTPDAISLQRALAALHADHVDTVAFEASSIGLEQRRLDGTAINVAVFSNLSRDHLDYHQTMQAYRAAKQRLFGWPGLQAVVVNTDDPAGADMLRAVADGVQRYTCGFGRSVLPADARVLITQCDADDNGMRLTLALQRHGEPTEEHAVTTPVIGRFNAANAALVCTAWLASGVPFASAVQRLAMLCPVAGRMQAHQVPGQPMFVVDYAHTPDALENALSALQPFAGRHGGSLWVVFGCGGDRDPGKRAEMGEVAQRCADHVVITSDNPRGEAPGSIIRDILNGLDDKHDATVTVNEDRRAAIGHALHHAAAHDVVLVAGKGHEHYQEIAGVRHDFDDWQVCRDAVATRGALS